MAKYPNGIVSRKPEPVVHVIAGAQGQAERQRPARVPAELVEPGEQVPADQRLLGDRGDRGQDDPVDDVVGGHVPGRDLADQPVVVASRAPRTIVPTRPHVAAGRDAERGPGIVAPRRPAQPEDRGVLAGPAQQQQGQRHHRADLEVAEHAQDEVRHRVGTMVGNLVMRRPAGVSGQQVDRGDHAGYQERELNEPDLQHQPVPGQSHGPDPPEWPRQRWPGGRRGRRGGCSCAVGGAGCGAAAWGGAACAQASCAQASCAQASWGWGFLGRGFLGRGGLGCGVLRRAGRRGGGHRVHPVRRGRGPLGRRLPAGRGTQPAGGSGHPGGGRHTQSVTVVR